MENIPIEKTFQTETVISYLTRTKYRQQGLGNLLRMGHCAPAVMQTLQDIDHHQEEWLVKLTAGLPGGIGNTGFECGGVTSTLIRLGLDHGLSTDHDGLPKVISAAHEYCQRFNKCNHSLLCQEILGDRRVPLPCIKAVRHAPELYKETAHSDNGGPFSGETGESFRLLYVHLSDNNFHCAHAVLNRLGHIIPVTPELLDGTSGFMGGTAFQGKTCSAFTAGVMAVGLKMGEIEDSYPRVFRMLATMIAGGNAMADHMNRFNRIVNIGQRMSKWFTQEFGSTQCHEITRCQFSKRRDVKRFIENGSVTGCRKIAAKVAGQVEEILRSEKIGS
jgi:C_GCAxxG_C_C family probable redox protein